jgi:hypothetical protein
MAHAHKDYRSHSVMTAKRGDHASRNEDNQPDG